MTTASERRTYPRQASSANVEFLHHPTRRRFPGRCLDISRGGLLMYVPATAPLQVGHELDLTVTGDAGEYVPARGIRGEIVRVNRQALISAGQVAVGVKFSQPRQ